VHSAADTPSRYDNGPRQAVEAARAAWASTKPANYTFTVSLVCFCMTPPIHITVRETHVSSVTMEPGFDHKYAGKEVPRSEWARYFGLPIPDLIALVHKSLRDRTLIASAQFEKRYGYPLRFHVGGDAGIADSDGGFVIEDFKVQE
jgi:hypothetical protein